MRSTLKFASLAGLALLAAGILAMPVARGAEGWHASIEKGLEAAGKSGRPVLVVTAWKDGV
ncbi:MAG: hypothetical protein O2894_09930 [Planctomycetota bacterium]|nr:hypothetical protein [Planctomycetota bacterium]